MAENRDPERSVPRPQPNRQRPAEMFHAPVAVTRPLAGRGPGGRADLTEVPEEDHLSYIELRDGVDPQLGRPLPVGRSALGGRLRPPFDPYSMGEAGGSTSLGPEPAAGDPADDGPRTTRRTRSLFGPPAPRPEDAAPET